MNYKRGEIYWVNLDPTIGLEIKKTRPGLIISNDIANKYSSRLVIVPITSRVERIYPFEAKILIPQRESQSDDRSNSFC